MKLPTILLSSFFIFNYGRAQTDTTQYAVDSLFIPTCQMKELATCYDFMVVLLETTEDKPLDPVQSFHEIVAPYQIEYFDHEKETFKILYVLGMKEVAVENNIFGFAEEYAHELLETYSSAFPEAKIHKRIFTCP